VSELFSRFRQTDEAPDKKGFATRLVISRVTIADRHETDRHRVKVLTVSETIYLLDDVEALDKEQANSGLDTSSRLDSGGQTAGVELDTSSRIDSGVLGTCLEQHGTDDIKEQNRRQC
jgi:hypothetical protein